MHRPLATPNFAARRIRFILDRQKTRPVLRRIAPGLRLFFFTFFYSFLLFFPFSFSLLSGIATHHSTTCLRAGCVRMASRAVFWDLRFGGNRQGFPLFPSCFTLAT
jgi:hypothetical protein